MRVVNVSQEEASTSIGARVGIMVLIFSVSLFSASFPSLTRRVRRLSIPAIVFFIGKHFGTGVILSTAFVHLLQDAFESLMDPRVREQTQVGHWAGLIVLASLLLIFIVEYVSTAYVDRLHSYDSAPPSPKSKPIALPTPPTERSPLLIDRTPAQQSAPTSPRLPPPPHSATTAHVHIHTHADGHDANPFFSGHHRHETRASHSEHGRGNHPRLASYAPGEPPAACPHGPPSRMSSKSRIRSAPQSPALGRYTAPSQGMEPSPSPTASTAVEDRGEEEEEEDDDVYGVFGHAHHGHGHPHPHPHGGGGTEIGRKRQIVGILVLQLGIMLHSAVIGLTLSIASGADLTSLVTAIVFHQLFEGLSLGVRIAALPPSTPATLKTLLVTLFALTTPTGIAIGLVTLRKVDTVSLLLTEGLLSAVSAGMLVYAATVEMLAADFVLDPALARAPVRRQALALASLAAGAAGMAVIGIVH